jgi:hypothetical protein
MRRRLPCAYLECLAHCGGLRQQQSILQILDAANSELGCERCGGRVVCGFVKIEVEVELLAKEISLSR